MLICTVLSERYKERAAVVHLAESDFDFFLNKPEVKFTLSQSL